MGNITGEPFSKGVKDQIKTRQTKLGKLNRNNEDLLFYNSKTAWIRLASSIDVNEEAIKKNIPELSTVASKLAGSGLARKCVLFGGLSMVNDIGSIDSINFRQGIQTNEDILEGAYGFGGTKDSGFRPMPGIIGANVSFFNRGALQKATINFKVFNTTQLQIIDTLYLKIGYTMLLEYGWSLYFKDDPLDGPKLTPANLITKPLTALFVQNDSSGSNQQNMLKNIKDEREASSYNYDAMFGKVTNFNWKFNPDGSYDCTLNLVGLGDIIESLKINTASGIGEESIPGKKQIAAQRSNAAASAAARGAEGTNSALFDDWIEFKHNNKTQDFAYNLFPGTGKIGGYKWQFGDEYKIPQTPPPPPPPPTRAEELKSIDAGDRGFKG